MAIDREWLRAELVRREGVKLYMHRDPKGLWSIGVGHCVQHIPELVAIAECAEARCECSAHGTGADRRCALEDLAINRTQAYGMRDNGIDTAVNDVGAIFGHLVPEFDMVRHTALVEMAYMLGFNGLAEFVLMRAGANRRDWDVVAAECLDSAEARRHEEWGSDRWRGIANRLREGGDAHVSRETPGGEEA